MTPTAFVSAQKTIVTPSGEIACLEHGAGPAALFVHGVPLNGYHWRHVLPALGQQRRCIVPDLMGLGRTEVADGQDLGFEAQARMLLQLLDTLGIDEVDVVGNDSGGAIAQVVAMLAPERLRTLTLTNCDTLGNWPPPALQPLLDIARAGQLGETFAAFLQNPNVARSQAGLGMAFEFSEHLTQELLEIYLGPVTATIKRRAEVDRYVQGIEVGPPAGLAVALGAFSKPTLIVWGDSDVFFPVGGARALAALIPGAGDAVVLEGARLFFPEERPGPLIAAIEALWRAASL